MKVPDWSQNCSLQAHLSAISAGDMKSFFIFFLFCLRYEQTAHSSVSLFSYQMLNFFESSTFHHSITKTKNKSFICCIYYFSIKTLFGLFFILFSDLSTVSNNLNNYNSLKVKPKNFSNKS